jgi:hypothetical protein
MVTQQEIKDNLILVEQGLPLSMPLADLGLNFKIQYSKNTGITVPLEKSPKFKEYLERKKKVWIRFCPIDNKRFKTHQVGKIFCCEECRVQYHKELRKIRLEQKICTNCGGPRDIKKFHTCKNCRTRLNHYQTSDYIKKLNNNLKIT